MFESKFEFNLNKNSFIKLIDFGFSLDLNLEMSQSEIDLLTPLIMGTLTYLPPEMFTT